jgi:serine/threonine-protein kinase
MSTVVPTAFEPGRIIGQHFRVERVLAVGGMGVVVAATHLELDRLVALKFITDDAARGTGVAARFKREARAAAKLRSPHVVQILDVDSLEDGTPYIVMEHLEGEDLAERIARVGRLPIADAVAFVLQACEALAEAHARGIIHRDLKPANLFCTTAADGSTFVKLLDFGISKFTEAHGGEADLSLTSTTEVIGSPMYMSPEQLTATRDVDERADIWALGVVLYEALAGELPFTASSLTQLTVRILQETPQPLTQVRPEIPARLAKAVHRCLQKKPEARFASLIELGRAIEDFGGSATRGAAERLSAITAQAQGSLPGERTIVSHEGAWSGGSGTERSKPTARVGWLVALLALAAGVVVFVLSMGDGGAPGEGTAPLQSAHSRATPMPPRSGVAHGTATAPNAGATTTPSVGAPHPVAGPGSKGSGGAAVDAARSAAGRAGASVPAVGSPRKSKPSATGADFSPPSDRR